MSQSRVAMKTVVPIAIAGALVLGYLLWPAADVPVPEEPVAQVETKPETPQQSAPDPMTVGGQWNWDNVKMQRDKKAAQPEEKKQVENDTGPEDFPYTAEDIYTALEQIRLNPDGSLIMDAITLAALQDALGSSSNLLTDENMAILQEIIQIGLPGAAGEQTAELVGNFHEYLKARQDYMQISSPAQAPGPDAQLKQYQEQVALREVYLGESVSKQLFAKSDADARYMISSMEVLSNKDLNTDQKLLKQKEVVDRHINETLSIYGLEDKYQAFVNKRDLILSSNLSEDELDKQLNAALQSSFTSKELDALQHLPLLND